MSHEFTFGRRIVGKNGAMVYNASPPQPDPQITVVGETEYQAKYTAMTISASLTGELEYEFYLINVKPIRA